MDSALKEQLHQIADKLEHFLFGGHVGLTQEQINYFQSFFSSDSYVFTTNLIKHFKQELCVGFAFNILLLGVLVFFIPSNFQTCWGCNSLMTLWLLALAVLNAILVLPKAILVQKLFRIEETVDIYMANFSIWNFFRSRVYKFNIMMSRYIFCTYIVGAVLLALTWTTSEKCDSFQRLVTFLLASFMMRIVSSFWKFVQNFGQPQHAENLFELFNGTSSEDIQSLKVCKHHEYAARVQRNETECSICYEKYEANDEVRVMNCPGDHAFHKKCIDKWLLKSTRCPHCNLSIFWKLEQEKKKQE